MAPSPLCWAYLTARFRSRSIWEDDISENPALDAVEIWEIYNFTMDADLIHIDEIQFQSFNLETFDGEVRPPEPGETGTKTR